MKPLYRLKTRIVSEDCIENSQQHQINKNIYSIEMIKAIYSWWHSIFSPLRRLLLLKGIEFLLFSYQFSYIFHYSYGVLERKNYISAEISRWTIQQNSRMSRLMTKPTKWHVRPAKTQISLGIRPVWSECSLSAWRKLWSLATPWEYGEDSDQTGRMPRLIWVFAGRICHFVGFVMRRLMCNSHNVSDGLSPAIIRASRIRDQLCPGPYWRKPVISN